MNSRLDVEVSVVRGGDLRRTIVAIVLIVSPVAFLLLSGQLISSRGPIRFEAPQTVYSNGHVAERVHVPYLLFLGELRRRLPAGSTVVVVGRSRVFQWDEYLTAVGQLPDQRVSRWDGTGITDGSAPLFLAVVGSPCDAKDYRLDVALPHGCLYEIKR